MANDSKHKINKGSGYIFRVLYFWNGITYSSSTRIWVLFYFLFFGSRIKLKELFWLSNIKVDMNLRVDSEKSWKTGKLRWLLKWTCDPFWDPQMLQAFNHVYLIIKAGNRDILCLDTTLVIFIKYFLVFLSLL